MDLILWRHAEAEDGGVDLKRSLTKRGRKQAERMADLLRPRLAGEWRILVSPAKRALQTVKPLDLAFEEREALGTSTSPELVLSEAGWPSGAQSVVVVGHQPTLGQVAARLLGTAESELGIRKGAIWWFEARDRGGSETILKAVLGPDLLES